MSCDRDPHALESVERPRSSDWIERRFPNNPAYLADPEPAADSQGLYHGGPDDSPLTFAAVSSVGGCVGGDASACESTPETVGVEVRRWRRLATRLGRQIAATGVVTADALAAADAAIAAEVLR